MIFTSRYRSLLSLAISILVISFFICGFRSMPENVTAGAGMENNVIVKDGSIDADETWTADHVYIVPSGSEFNGRVVVSDGVTLTIEAGTVVKFEYEAQIDVLGTLDVQGTPTNPVVFTSHKDDDHGGDTNGDGDATSPASADWGLIYFSGSTNIFENALVQYARYGVVTAGENSQTISNNTFRFNVTGVTVGSLAPANISDNVFEQNFEAVDVKADTAPTINMNVIRENSFGIQIKERSAPTVSNNVFEDSERWHLSQYPNATPIYSGNTFSGTGGNGIAIGAGINPFIQDGDDITWEPLQNLNWPYVLTSSIIVQPGGKLTLPAGTILKFSQDLINDTKLRLEIRGVLDVQGSPSNRVIFTSNKDDVIGGDSNGDGGATYSDPGDWAGILLTGGESSINYAIVQYAETAVSVQSQSTAAITNCIIRYNKIGIDIYQSESSFGQDGVFLDNYDAGMISAALPVLQNNAVFRNSNYGMSNSSGAMVDAENMWWGDSSGPYHPTQNSNGQGDEVGNDIDFAPWLPDNPFPIYSDPATPVLNDIINHEKDGNFQVSWNDVNDAEIYTLQELGAVWNNVYYGSDTNTNLADKSNRNWCYRVRSSHSYGTSGWSESKCTTVESRLIVVKMTAPAGDVQTFTFTLAQESGEQVEEFMLSDMSLPWEKVLWSDTFSVVETIPANWIQDIAECDDGSDPSSIQLDDGETVTCTFVNRKLTQPGADFTASPTSGPPPLKVFFKNLSIGDYDSCKWHFGGAMESDVCHDPSAIYTEEGHYTVSLTVAGPNGMDTKTLEKYITVSYQHIFLPGVMGKS